jgi:hypothetical protein
MFDVFESIYNLNFDILVSGIVDMDKKAAFNFWLSENLWLATQKSKRNEWNQEADIFSGDGPKNSGQQVIILFSVRYRLRKCFQ